MIAKAAVYASKRLGLTLGASFLILPALFMIMVFAHAVMPASLWLTVERVHVFDAITGTAPAMEVDRVIHRPFEATWRVEIFQVFEGVQIKVCWASEDASYHPDNFLPDPLNLDWWTFPTKCLLIPGTYRVDTQWHLPFGKIVSTPSNVFEVRTL